MSPTNVNQIHFVAMTSLRRTSISTSSEMSIVVPMFGRSIMTSNTKMDNWKDFEDLIKMKVIIYLTTTLAGIQMVSGTARLCTRILVQFASGDILSMESNKGRGLDMI